MKHETDKHMGDEDEALYCLVNDFKKAMYDKLEDKKCEAWEGWDNPGDQGPETIKAPWGIEEIRERIKAQLDKPGGGDPVDIANFCAFWWNLMCEHEWGEPAAPQVIGVEVCVRCGETRQMS